MYDLTPDTGFSNKKIKQFFTLAVIILFTVELFNHLKFILSAFFGAVTLYILLRKPHKRLIHRYKWKSVLTTIFLMTCSIILLLVPFYFIIRFVLIKISPFIISPEPLINGIITINAYVEEHFDFTLFSQDNLDKVKHMATQILPDLIGSGLLNITNLIMLYFILWFMLRNSFKMERWIKLNSPFNRVNTILILNELKKGVTNNSVGIVILGLAQGMVAILGYYIFGVSEPVLWGLITGAASVLPFVGTMIVWVPMVLLLFANGQSADGAGLTLWGLFIIGGIDNVLRFLLQKQMSQTPELITVLGVIAGLTLFGFWGLIFGPLMISFLILLCRIYKKEYMVPYQKRPEPNINLKIEEDTDN